MGLDMYMYAERYVSGYEFRSTEEKKMFSDILTASDLTKAACDHTPSLTVRVCCGYWRKANEIHKFFVDNVQDGNDDCKDYWVSEEKIKELADLCDKVMADQTKENAENLLPTQSGFFFGGTDYDEYYFANIKETGELMRKLLKLKEEDGDIEFYYSSSW